MARQRRQPVPEQDAGAPEWMVTFSDCMTLLLTFFVLLLSFSSFDEKTLSRLKKTFTKEFSSIGFATKDKSSLTETNLIQYNDNLEKGSEKPTLTKKEEDNLLKETESKNFHEQKVFLSPSKAIFWGNGRVISFQGQKTLSDMASFLKEVPSKVVVSENGQSDGVNNEHLGLQRAWEVVEYLTEKQGLDKERFSIAAGTLQKNDGDDLQDHSQATQRMLEIVLLERSIYD
jgi:chemotaxis protein MotB